MERQEKERQVYIVLGHFLQWKVFIKVLLGCVCSILSPERAQDIALHNINVSNNSTMNLLGILSRFFFVLRILTHSEIWKRKLHCQRKLSLVNPRNFISKSFRKLVPLRPWLPLERLYMTNKDTWIQLVFPHLTCPKFGRNTKTLFCSIAQDVTSLSVFFDFHILVRFSCMMCN